MSEIIYPKQSIASSIFYYSALIIMVTACTVALYWQLEPDHHSISYNEIEFTSTPENRSFFVPIYFCADGLTEFTLVRAYHDTDNDLWYAVPDSRHKTGSGGCFDTRIQAHTGRLDPGNYEYHVHLSYDLNPLRTVQKQVALVRVTIE